MRPEKYKHIYWKIEFLDTIKEWYYVLSTMQSMKDVEKYPIKENALDDCIMKFKKSKKIKY